MAAFSTAETTTVNGTATRVVDGITLSSSFQAPTIQVRVDPPVRGDYISATQKFSDGISSAVSLQIVSVGSPFGGVKSATIRLFDTANGALISGKATVVVALHNMALEMVDGAPLRQTAVVDLSAGLPTSIVFGSGSASPTPVPAPAPASTPATNPTPPPSLPVQPKNGVRNAVAAAGVALSLILLAWSRRD